MARKKRPLRFKIFVLIFICLIFIGGIKAIELVQKFFCDSVLDFQKLAVIDYDTDKNLIVHPLKKDIIVYNKNKLKAFNLEGIEKWDIEKEIKNPFLKSSEDIIFLGDREKGSITAVNLQGSVIWDFSIEKPIREFVCNKEGISAFYTEENGKSKIYILNIDGKEEGKIIVNKGSIMGIAISDNNMIAISVLNIDNNKIETNVALYSNKGKLLGGHKYDKEPQIVSNLFFSEDHRLMNVGDSQLMVFSKEDRVLWSEDIPDSINRIAWNKKGFIVMYLVDNKKSILDTKNRNYLSIIDIEGKKMEPIPIQGEVLGIDSKGDNIVAFTDRTLYMILETGKKLMEKKVNNDIQSVYIISDNQLVLVLKDKLEIIQVKYKER
ncbi:DUF5711 family protein [Crassaminicella indica]|uniref:Uncharacterized protein n=1 Tax=Crassaminicella indica TaxID=2855394 RepID=A0ABX8RFA6_9CLOT|nr:DUF5711 family protein [Crassaminicella indica]QXM06997.1 hypothetical protein KVH43_04580 [Crassaminicella indica]